MAHKPKTNQREDTERAGMSAQATDSAAQQQSQAMAKPQKGDTYRCNGCGMELEITENCNCTHPEAVHFQCCGAEMSAVR